MLLQVLLRPYCGTNGAYGPTQIRSTREVEVQRLRRYGYISSLQSIFWNSAPVTVQNPQSNNIKTVLLVQFVRGLWFFVFDFARQWLQSYTRVLQAVPGTDVPYAGPAVGVRCDVWRVHGAGQPLGHADCTAGAGTSSRICLRAAWY